jgi:Tfp pilus assembly PilM family ATPase
MSFILGLDIGSRSIAGAVFAGSSKKFRLVDFFVEDIPAPGDQAQESSGEYVPPLSLEEVLQKVITERRLGGSDVIASIDAKDCIIREFAVPFTKDADIRRMVKFEAENHFQTMDMEEVVLEYFKVGESNGKSQLVATAARNDLVASRLALLKLADLDPLALDLDAAALLNAFSLTPAFDPAKGTLLIDMGATAAKILLVEGGKLKKIRSLRVSQTALSPDRLLAEPALAGAAAGARPAAEGGPELPFEEYSIETRFREIENALRRLDPVDEPPGEPLTFTETPIAILSDEDYERVRGGGSAAEEEAAAGAGAPAGNGSAPGSAPAGELSYGAYLERIALELRRTFATTRSPIERICLTGGRSGREEAVRYFTEELGVETVQLDFTGGLATDLGEEAMGKVGRQGAVAVGLALKELGHDLTGLDFRKGKFRYEHRFLRLKGPLLLLSLLAALIFFQTALWSYHEYLRLSQRAADFRAETAEVYKRFFGKDLPPGRDALPAAQDQKKKWEGTGIAGMGAVIDCVEAIRNVGEVLGQSGVQFTITRVDFKFAVRKGGGTSGGKRIPARAEESQIDLLVKDSSAHLALDRKFREPLSKFFDARASSAEDRQSGGFKVTLRLTPKASVLAQIERSE